MSNLKQVVQNSLRIRQTSPDIIESVDVLIHRALIDLQKNGLLPPRTWEFTSLTEKQEKRDSNGDLLYNYYYLPEDFRKLEEFRPRTKYPYTLVHDINEVYWKDLSESQEARITRKFVVTDVNFEDDTKTEKVLVAFPFPADDNDIEVRYWSNGKNQNWDWVDEDYYEAVISWIYGELGLRSPQEVDDDLGRAVATHREQGGNAMDNGKRTLGGGSFFGKRSRDYFGRNYRKNQLN